MQIRMQEVMLGGMTDTTIRVSVNTRDRVRSLSQGQTAEEVIVAALDELERRRRRDRMREEASVVSQDPADLAEVRQIAKDMVPARAW
jgi:hypothetical protein